nr:translation initiation factor eIF-2B subunit alpha [Polyrhizophydium stewartii]
MTAAFDIVECMTRIRREQPDMSLPVVAVKSLIESIKNSQASTTTELMENLGVASRTLKSLPENKISMIAGSDLFEVERLKELIISKGEKMVESCGNYRQAAAESGVKFIKDDAVILIHSYSRVVMMMLVKAAVSKRFKVIVTDASPSDSGRRAVEELRRSGIPAALINDTAVGYIIEKVDMVLVGAEGVVQNGGLINQIGTYQIAVVSKAANKPFYAVTESYKFVQLFPLNQDDLPISSAIYFTDEEDGGKCLMSNPTIDYTPPNYISMIFTDVGVLTPSGVAEQLMPSGQLTAMARKRAFCFDHVFDGADGIGELFDQAVLPLVESCLAGFNVSLLSIGCSGSGKSFVLGTPRRSSSGACEIYGDWVRDLLDPRKDGLRVDVTVAEGPTTVQSRFTVIDCCALDLFFVDSLGGNCIVSFVMSLNPADSVLLSINALSFAESMRQLVTFPVLNVVIEHKAAAERQLLGKEQEALFTKQALLDAEIRHTTASQEAQSRVKSRLNFNVYQLEETLAQMSGGSDIEHNGSAIGRLDQLRQSNDQLRTSLAELNLQLVDLRTAQRRTAQELKTALLRNEELGLEIIALMNQKVGFDQVQRSSFSTREYISKTVEELFASSQRYEKIIKRQFELLRGAYNMRQTQEQKPETKKNILPTGTRGRSWKGEFSYVPREEPGDNTTLAKFDQIHARFLKSMRDYDVSDRIMGRDPKRPKALHDQLPAGPQHLAAAQSQTQQHVLAQQQQQLMAAQQQHLALHRPVMMQGVEDHAQLQTPDAQESQNQQEPQHCVQQGARAEKGVKRDKESFRTTLVNIVM